LTARALVAPAVGRAAAYLVRSAAEAGVVSTRAALAGRSHIAFNGCRTLPAGPVRYPVKFSVGETFV
jgi:hypothetical protein